MACHADHRRCRLHDHAYALVGLQFCLAAINIRGVYKNE